MSENLKLRLAAAVGIAANTLVAGEYELLEATTSGRWMTASELRKAVEDYPLNLVPAKASAYKELQVVEVQDAEPPVYLVDFDLWSDDGPSDLTLQLELVEEIDGAFDIRIRSVHVM